MPDGMTMTVSGTAADTAERSALRVCLFGRVRRRRTKLTLSAIGHVTQRNADGSETELAPSYTWYRKGRGETKFQLVGADGNLAGLERPETRDWPDRRR